MREKSSLGLISAALMLACHLEVDVTFVCRNGDKLHDGGRKSGKYKKGQMGSLHFFNVVSENVFALW
jgi:hypothetical protein